MNIIYYIIIQILKVNRDNLLLEKNIIDIDKISFLLIRIIFL